MHLPHSLLQHSLLALGAHGSTAAAVRHRGSDISWNACDEELEAVKYPNTTIQCANLSVPLDYTNVGSNETINLELLRVPAQKQPSKGSILFNFGGPGQVGRANLASGSYEYMPAVGYQHDLVVFDPRGTVNTLTSTCYNESESASNSLKYPLYSNSSDTALGEIWSSGTLNVEKCYQKNKDIGSFMGTAFVARDLISVVDALGEDGLLRYWGISYGTTLGATVAAIFPDRVDKVLLDGVLNSHEYYHAYELETLTDADKVISGFFSGCAAAPQACPLARNNASAAQLEAEFYAFLYDLKRSPIPVAGDSLVDYQSLKTVIVGSVYAPNSWPALALALDGLYAGNATAFADLSGKFEAAVGMTTPDAEPAIKCAEKTVRTAEKGGMMEHVRRKYGISKILGDVYIASDFKCAQWKMEAREIYQGDFHTKTKNPLLLIGNTYDPLTPLVSAKNMSSGFEDSVLLEQIAYGHGSTSQPSVCAMNAIQNYFAKGELPEPGTVCDSQKDVPLFSTKSITDVFAKTNIQPPDSKN